VSNPLPVYTLPATNRRAILCRRPVGIPQADDFALDDVPLDPVGKGQFRVRNIYLSVDPAQRGWANEGTNYADPVPLGGVMRALAVSVVVESLCPDVPVGLHLYGWFGWQDYAVAGPEAILTRIEEVTAPLSAYAGVLGMNGLTAWLALNRIGRPKSGDTVLVTTAAGAVGSLVGQIARAQGCRVVGLTGDDAKVALCKQRFGYHDAANYKKGDPAAAIAAIAPAGVDVFFDNVGGPMLDCAIRQMNVGGRIVQCGTASIANWNPPPTGLRNEREVLTRRLQWGGFVIFDHLAAFPEAMAALSPQVASGALAYEEHIQQGIAHAPGAIAQLYAGENLGKSLIFVGD
jgi:NADPH-dependent curcumin reductase CurA